MAIDNFQVLQKGLKYSLFHDLYYRMIKTSWTKFFLFAGFFYIILNLIFALVYLYSPAEILNARPGSLWDAFIFSFQTSSTIGYGHFLPNTETAHLIVFIDTLFGIFYVAIITGMAFAKFARPSARVVFTQNMLFTKFDDIPTLSFRLANARETHIIDTSIKVAALIPYTSTEGHTLRRLYNLELFNNENPSFALTWTVMHQITERSPLFGLTPKDIEEREISFIISFTGIDHILSQPIHSNHRYSAQQVISATKFTDILIKNGDNSFEVDFEKFNSFEA